MENVISPSKIARQAREYRAWVRAQASKRGTSIPVVVVDGDVAPRRTGAGFRFVTPGGNPVYHPNAYRRAWGKPVYVPSTIRVEVGAAWLRDRGINPGMLKA